MSDKNNRVNPDYSIYDLMETAALEEILRQDAEAPEGEESDLELILYVMEVLAERRKTSGEFTGKTVEEAYESFIQHYLPEVEALENRIVKKENAKRHPMLRLRRLAAVAAVVAVIFVGTVTAKAFGVDVWNIVATWATETFHLGTAGNNNIDDPVTDNQLPYASLQEAIDYNFSNPVKVPTWIPEGYELVDINIHENPQQKRYIAIYDNGELRMKISVQFYLDFNPEQMEQGEGFVEIYSFGGIDYYLFSNLYQAQAVWVSDNYECYISGELTIEELKMMIDSIGKG